MILKAIKNFKVIYLVERHGGSKKFLKLLGGRVLGESAKAKPGYVRVEFVDHGVEVRESALLNALVLGYEPKCTIGNKSRLILECFGSGLGSREIFTLLNKYGVEVRYTLISTVRHYVREHFANFAKKKLKP